MKLTDHWFRTEMGHFYLKNAYHSTGEYSLYYVNGEKISRVGTEKAPIKAVKTYEDDVYYLTRYERGILDADQTTNLKAATFTNGKWVSDFLGKPGFYYTFDTMGKAYDWPIDANGITTIGYQRSGHLSKEDRLNTLGYYRLALKGHDHELIKR